MTDKKIRIAVVGTGNVAQVAHLPAYRQNADVEIAALVDANIAKARQVARQYVCDNVYEDLTDMLRHEEIDAVDICTPNYLHAPMAIAALRAGRHVLVEKPIARNAAEAQKMVDTSRDCGKILMVAMNNRFRRDVEILQKFISRGELGDVQLVKAGWRRTAQDWREREWLTDQRKSGGGALLDLGVPLMDLAMWITGLKKSTRVTCSVFGRAGRSGVEDSACAMVNFAGGSCFILEVTWNLLEPKDHTYLEVYGTKGGASLQPLRVQKALHGQLVNVTPALEGPHNYYQQSYKREIDHFIECVRKESKPLTPGEEALSVLKILDSMYESAAAGKEVSIS